MSNETVVIKLSSGEVIVANIVDGETQGVLELTNVCRLVEVHVPVKGEDGQEVQQANLAMYPFMPYTRAVDSLLVGLQQVVFMVEPVEEIKENHRAHFDKARSALPIITGKQGLILPE